MQLPSPERSARAAEPLGAPRPGRQISESRGAAPRVSARRLAETQPRESRPGLSRLRSLSFLLPSAAPRVASAAPGPLKRGRLLFLVAERRRRDPRDKGRRARARRAGSRRTGSARGRCRGGLSGQAPGRGTSARLGPAAASCSLRAPPQMSRGPEPRPSPSPEQLGVCAAG